MFRTTTRSFLTLILLLTVVLAACRRDDPTPTPAPTQAPATPTTAPDPTDPPPTPTPAPADFPGTSLDPANIDWAPQVVYSSPAPGEETVLDGAITIRFDQPMDRDSVAEALQVTAVDDNTRVAGNLSWPRPDTLIFTPQSDLKRDAAYRVRLDTGAAGLNGKTLEDIVELQLETVGFLAVAQVAPAPNLTDVQTDATITVFFNRPVVPLVATGQQADLPDPLRFSPEVSGTGQWVGTSIYRFTPDGPLAGATNYQVVVDAGLTDISGAALGDAYAWSFRTLAPRVVFSEPGPGAQQVSPTAPISITFNMPMDRSSTEAAISLDPPAPLTFNWTADSRVVGVTPETRLDLATRYRLQVATTALSANGAASLDERYSATFTTVPFPGIRDVFPEPGSEAEFFQRGVHINFASPMDISTIQDRLIIEPAPEGSVREFYGEPFSDFYGLDFAFEPRTEYVVTIPGDVADPYGNTLGEAFTWRFTTGGALPILSFNLPHNPSQLTAARPSDVTLIQRNVSPVNVRLLDVGLPINGLLQPWQINDRNRSLGGDVVWQASFDAPTAEDVIITRTLRLGDGGALPNGVYILVADAPGFGVNRDILRNDRFYLVVADSNVVIREMVNEIYLWVTDIASAQPLAGREVSVYDRNGRLIGTATTDGDGFASLDRTDRADYLENVLAVTGAPGEPGFGIAASSWSGDASPWQFNLFYNPTRDERRVGYIYTDRPLYRPGDTIYFRGIVRDANLGRYQLPSVETVTIALESNRFGPEGQRFAEEFDVQLDANGNFSGQFELPEDAELSGYSLRISENDIDASRFITVAEYRRPEFVVGVSPEKEDALQDEPVEVTVQADFLFGAPASDLVVEYVAFLEPYALPFSGRFNYGVYEEFGFFPEPGFFGREIVRQGQGRTDSDGRFTFTLPAGLLDNLENGPEPGRSSVRVIVEATVIDLSEARIAASTEIVYHPAEVYVGVAPENYVSVAERPADVRLQSVDWEGEPVGNRPVDAVVYRREWIPIRENQFGRFVTRWETEDTEIDRLSTTTDAEGEAVVSFVPPEGGTYIVEATIRDAAGRTQTSEAFMWVSDVDFVGWRVAATDRKIELTPDQPSYVPGDTARILVQSPFEGEIVAWVSVERGGLLSQRVETLPNNSAVIDIPITPEMAPNAFVTVILVQGADDAPYADIRLGIVELEVSREQLLLNLTLTPQTDTLAPGETVDYEIRATDFAGRPVQADVTLALVDLAVLTLLPDNNASIADTFYSRQPYRSAIGAGLFVSGEGIPVQIPEELGGMGGGGGGDVAAEAEESLFARDADESGGEGGEDSVRQEFPDTAYWEAIITTGADGTATISVPLPDSTTTWRLSARAATPDTRVGAGEVDVVATLPLLIRPVTPRFFTVGDIVEVGAIVNNNSETTQDVTVSLEATGVTMLDGAEQGVTVAPGTGQRVRWTVRVDDVEFADLTFRARSEAYRDASKPTFGVGPEQLIPVYRYDAEDIVGTAGVLTDPGRRVEAVLLPPGVDTREGELVVNLSPSLAAALLETLDFIADDNDYDPTCAHSVANRLLPNVATAAALGQLDIADPQLAQELTTVIERDLQRIASVQLGGGGWGYCRSDQDDPYLTAYIVLALVKAQQAGYAVDKETLDDGSAYLLRQVAGRSIERLSSDWAVNRHAFFLYVAAEAGLDVGPMVDTMFEEQRARLDPYAKALLALAYEVGGGAGSDAQQALLNDLNDEVILSATAAHWEDASRDWRNLNTNIRGTAIIIDVLARIEPDHPLLPPAVRWLMVARTAGHWSSHHETAWSVLALTDWMVAAGELNADFPYLVNVNAGTLDEGRFTRENVISTRSLRLPVSDLALEDINFVDFQRGAGDGRLYYTLHLDSFIDASTVNAVDRGLSIERVYYDADCDPDEETCQPIDTIAAGESVRVVLTIIVPNDLTYVVIEDPLPSGAEAVDPGLATSSRLAESGVQRVSEDYRYGYWGWWYFNSIQFQDEKVVFTTNYLPAGTYQYSYTLNTLLPGEFQVRPAVGFEEFFPEVFGRSDGMVFVISE